MVGKRVFITLAATAGVVVLGAASAAASSYYDARDRVPGGFVQPCSLDGVNPAHHPGIFGNPALAYSVYGFVRSRDGSWQVERNCRRGANFSH
jgi:hypothetical protein